MKWWEIDKAAYKEWRRIFNEDWSGSRVSSPCPVCSMRTLYRWYFLESRESKVLRGRSFTGRGKLWEWCSTCRSFEHYPDGYVPDWWATPYEVDPSVLRRDPGPIEEARRSSEHGG